MELKRTDQIAAFLKDPGPARAALVFGRDLGVVRERGQAIAAATTERPDDPFNVAVLTEEDVAADPGRLELELTAVSMIGGRRLVRLRLSGGRGGGEKDAAEALRAHLAGELNPDAFFLIEAGDLTRGAALRQLAEKSPACGAVACYSDEVADLVRMTRESLAAEGLSLDSEALEVFVGRLPAERGVVRQEIERLVLYLGPGRGATASVAELEPFLGVEPDASLAEAASDAFGGRLAAAHAGLRRIAEEGDSGVPVVRFLSLHLARLRKGVAMRAAGATPREIALSCGVFWKQEREFQRQVRAWSSAELEVLAPEVLDADMACKQEGAHAPARLLAERLALSIAGRARRLGL